MSDSFVPGLRYASRSQELWALVVESFLAWEERVNQGAAAAGLSPVCAWALVQIDPEHPMSQKELAARLRCTPSTVVDPTDRLEAGGLVIRHANPADRRVNVLVVTPEGKRVRDELVRHLFDPPAVFRRLRAQELARFRDVMLAAVMEARRPAATPRAGRKQTRSKSLGARRSPAGGSL